MPQAIKSIELKKLGKPITVAIRQSSRAKLIAIRLGNRGLELVLPHGASKEKAYQFLLQKEAWIREKLAERGGQQDEPMQIFTQIPVFGVVYKVKYVDSANELTIIKSDQLLTVHAPIANANDVVVKYLQAECLREVKEMLNGLSQKYQIKVNGKISVKEVISKWGSCSSRGDLVFNWRLILAPCDVFEYVVVHEFCHLKEMHHGVEFWQLVEKMCPEYILARKWLRKNGHKLYKYFST